MSIKLAFAALLVACSGRIQTAGEAPAPPPTTDPGNAAGGTNGGSKPPIVEPAACPTVTPLPRRLRPLNSLQYRRSLKAALGVEDTAVVDPFAISDRAAEFSTNTELRRFDFRTTDTVMANAAKAATSALPRLKTRFACLSAVALDKSCLDAFVRTLGRELYRDPLDDARADKLIKLFEAAKLRAGLDAAIGVTVRAMLSSPHFLFRKELGEPRATGDGYQLSAHEIASALAYTLTDAPPDAVLRQAVDAGALTTLPEVRRQVERLLSERKDSEAGIDTFLRELLHGRDFLSSEKDEAAFPTFDLKTRQAVFADFNATLAAVWRSNTPTLRTLLAGKQMVVRPETATFLAWKTPAGLEANGELITAPEDSRLGVITHPVMMATFAHQNESNPVARGHFISKSILCVTVPPPPAAVVFPERDDGDGKTLRQTIEEMHSVAGCASCHRFMDPLGFPFEVFDPVGRLRTSDRGQPIDPSGEVVGTTDIDGPVGDVNELMTRIAGSRTAHTCFARSAFKYIAGVADDEHLDCRVEALAEKFITGGGDIPGLFTQALASELFLTRQ